MHPLLAPGARADANEACARYLRSSWSGFVVLRASLDRATRRDFDALCAWHTLVRELTDEARPDLLRRRALDELSAELEAVFAGHAGSVVGLALAPTVRRLDSPAHAFAGPLEERRRAEHVHAFETRDALAAHAGALARPEARLLLGALGASSERNEVFADALAVAVLLIRWLRDLRSELARGRLFLPVDELARHGVLVHELGHGDPPGLSACVAEHVAWTRGLLAKGWPLCAALGAVRGRQLAFFLRWHAATLGALEARRFQLSAGPPPAGALRFLACLGASAATPRAPRLV